MAVRIRMKRLGRAHRPFFRICATDKRTPRDGRVLEELGTYDPSVADTDARAVLKRERIDYWLGVGAQPSEKVAVLIKKYGTNGTHVSQQEAALAKLAEPKEVPSAGPAVSKPKQPEPETPAEAPPSEVSTEDAADAKAPAEEKPAEEASAEEASANDEAAAQSAPAESAEAASEESKQDEEKKEEA